MYIYICHDKGKTKQKAKLKQNFHIRKQDWVLSYLYWYHCHWQLKMGTKSKWGSGRFSKVAQGNSSWCFMHQKGERHLSWTGGAKSWNLIACRKAGCSPDPHFTNSILKHLPRHALPLPELSWFCWGLLRKRRQEKHRKVILLNSNITFVMVRCEMEPLRRPMAGGICMQTELKWRVLLGEGKGVGKGRERRERKRQTDRKREKRSSRKSPACPSEQWGAEWVKLVS